MSAHWPTGHVVEDISRERTRRRSGDDHMVMPLTADTSALHGVCESKYAGVLCKNEEIFDQKLENKVYHVAMTVISFVR